ncbi:MAG: hypothetical protein K6B46_02810 [Opitutales bacterium]|nr:hypothetical protein [Opitutales bacterium]
MTTSIIFAAIQWGVIGWVTLGTIVFVILVAAFGRAIAAAFPPSPEHMSNFKRPGSTRANVVAAAVASRSLSPKEVANVISEETMAIIAAAVAMALNGEKHTIKTVQQIAPERGVVVSAWAMDGVRSQMSHNIR